MNVRIQATASVPKPDADPDSLFWKDTVEVVAFIEWQQATLAICIYKGRFYEHDIKDLYDVKVIDQWR